MGEYGRRGDGGAMGYGWDTGERGKLERTEIEDRDRRHGGRSLPPSSEFIRSSHLHEDEEKEGRKFLY